MNHLSLKSFSYLERIFTEAGKITQEQIDDFEKKLKDCPDDCPKKKILPVDVVKFVVYLELLEKKFGEIAKKKESVESEIIGKVKGRLSKEVQKKQKEKQKEIEKLKKEENLLRLEESLVKDILNMEIKYSLNKRIKFGDYNLFKGWVVIGYNRELYFTLPGFAMPNP